MRRWRGLRGCAGLGDTGVTRRDGSAVPAAAPAATAGAVPAAGDAGREGPPVPPSPSRCQPRFQAATGTLSRADRNDPARDTRGPRPAPLGDSPAAPPLCPPCPAQPHLGTFPAPSGCAPVLSPRPSTELRPRDGPGGQGGLQTPQRGCGAKPLRGHGTPGTDRGCPQARPGRRGAEQRLPEENSRCLQPCPRRVPGEPARPAPRARSEGEESSADLLLSRSSLSPVTQPHRLRDGCRLAGISSRRPRSLPAPHGALGGTKGVLGAASPPSTSTECPRAASGGTQAPFEPLVLSHPSAERRMGGIPIINKSTPKCLS